jgi:conjugative relaxase-like TrwC/TraI family protein
MLTISKPLSARQAQTYHREEFENARENYYTEGERIRGEWHGKLADEWGLRGEVQQLHFDRLSEGQHPFTGEQLVRHQAAREYTNEKGEVVRTMEHRAGWDATLSAPKSVSLTALVGGDERVREAHRESVRAALDEMERYVQARIGGNHPPETTGKWVAAKFEHDSARPVDGYAAPQLHTHVVFFNLTETESGDVRAVQPQELYRTQQYATAVYRSELAHRLHRLGYEIERGKSNQPEIKGYSQEYLEASSPRRQQIKEHLEQQGLSGAGAAQIAAHQTREKKQGPLTHDEMHAKHKDLAKAYGNQPDRVVQEAKERTRQIEHDQDRSQHMAHTAVTFSRDRNLEREAVADERSLLRDALKRSMGEASFAELRTEFEKRVRQGEFIEVERKIGTPGRAYTTGEMIGQERDTINAMRTGQNQHPELASFGTRREIEREHAHLSQSQLAAVEQVLASRDQVTALEGVAGAGKTTSLAAVREAAEREGFQVRGLAPTSRAAQKLQEAGIESGTLQRHLAGAATDAISEGRRLYVLDESSLASTKQMNEFLRRLRDNDRVLLVGDVRQHQAVEAGRPYQQLQEAGIQTARLDEIVRQKDPALKEAVEQLAHGRTREAFRKLDEQGRVHEIVGREERMREIASQYLRRPDTTLVVSPDNRSRMELNDTIHRAMQSRALIDEKDHGVRVLVPRQEITGADRQWAGRYEAGDVIRYAKGSEAVGIRPHDYATVREVHTKQNALTVERLNGERTSYDPRRLYGITLYRETERTFSQGDRVQFTAPFPERHVANRELGTIKRLESNGKMAIRLDSGREIAFNVRENPHFDHGYAVTSHSSQGQTADRVLIHVDTERGGEHLINSRLAYVAVSRGRYDAQIYTNDKADLARGLDREFSKQAAIEVQPHAHGMHHEQGHSEGQEMGH